ncbi:MAG: hypothetical protein WDN08_07615 [Rhizomicrobium sp.]
MNKLPVGQTIRFAYVFTFAEIGTVIGLIWIPTLINSVAGFFVLRTYYQAVADMIDSAAPPPGGELLLPFLLLVLTLLLLAMIGAAISRQALGLRKGPAFVHFSFGRAELRVFGGFFGLYLLLLLFFIVFFGVTVGAAAGGVAAAAGNSGAAGLIGVGVSLLALAGLFAMIYIGVRLSFLMVPAVLDGHDFGLARSWELTKGNFWRIAAVGAATLLPVLLVIAVAETAILGPEFFVPPDPATAKDAAANLKQLAAQMRAVQAHMPLLMGLNFVVSPLLYGLVFAPAAFAYRILSGKAVVEPTA